MAKKPPTKTAGITLDLNDKIVVPVVAEEALICCSKCCFGFEGRAQRNCPKVNNNLLCILISVEGNEHTYFKEV